ncbi:hypothetical protein P7C73_g3034, partial [Tremellales sp. Uapishka_1]
MAALEIRVAKLEQALAEVAPHHPEINDHYYPKSPDGSAVKTVLPARPVPAEARPSLTRLLKTSYRSSRGCHPADLCAALQPDSHSSATVNPDPKLPPSALADRIFSSVYQHVQSRYPFLDWPRLRAWHSRREHVCHLDENSSTDDTIGAYFIWMIYAVGADLEPGTSGLENARSYFEKAWRYLETVIQPYDLAAVEALLLAVFYAFRSTAGPSLWLLGGFTMRMCVELGLHRKIPSLCTPSEKHRRQCVFWSAYAFDRLISHSSGRPVSIADKDIDVEMTTHAPYTSLEADTRRTNEGLTDMSSATHSIQLYRIRSRVHTAFYSLDPKPPSREETVGFLKELEDWRQNIPRLGSSGVQVPMQPESRFHMRYFQCVLYTLRPAVLRAQPSDPHLSLCATAAAEACETTVSVGHVFICGMTLLHCLCVSPAAIAQRVSARAIRACSTTLAVLAQLFSEAVPFYDLFEYMADEVLTGGYAGGMTQTTAIRHFLEGNSGPLTA